MVPDGSKQFFVNGQSYMNVYFLKVDASGHSNVVLNNPQDVAERFFDLFEKLVFSTVEQSQEAFGCKYAEFWGWQGDGGLCVIHDAIESTASKTAISIGMSIVDHKLNELREKLPAMNVRGQLSVRVAINRGHLTYKGDAQRGSIHSQELNFVAHLEEATPKDCVAIAEEVYRAASNEHRKSFQKLPFQFEGKDVYVYPQPDYVLAVRNWIETVAIEGSFQGNVVPRRLSEDAKAKIISTAEHEVIDCGTALSTCSQYLTSETQPGTYRHAVLDLLERGVNYTCLLLDPESSICRQYETVRGEDLRAKIRQALTNLKKFAETVKGKRGHFKIVLYDHLPYFASIVVDRESEGVSVFAPYMPSFPGTEVRRVESLHLIVGRATNEHAYMQILRCIESMLNCPKSREVTAQPDPIHDDEVVNMSANARDLLQAAARCSAKEVVRRIVDGATRIIIDGRLAGDVRDPNSGKFWSTALDELVEKGMLAQSDAQDRREVFRVTDHGLRIAQQTEAHVD